MIWTTENNIVFVFRYLFARALNSVYCPVAWHILRQLKSVHLFRLVNVLTCLFKRHVRFGCWYCIALGYNQLLHFRLLRYGMAAIQHGVQPPDQKSENSPPFYIPLWYVNHKGHWIPWWGNNDHVFTAVKVHRPSLSRRSRRRGHSFI